MAEDETGHSADAQAPEAAEPTGLDILKRERDDYYDRLLRKTAEFDNFRKRIERERQTQAEQAVAGVLKELLSVVDDFDRAVKTDATGVPAEFRKGIELIHTKLHAVLRRHGVRQIDALGTDFDPNVHEAVMYDESPDHREGEVVAELERGYMLGERLLRPARVKVAKA